MTKQETFIAILKMAKKYDSMIDGFTESINVVRRYCDKDTPNKNAVNVLNSLEVSRDAIAQSAGRNLIRDIMMLSE